MSGIATGWFARTTPNPRVVNNTVDATSAQWGDYRIRYHGDPILETPCVKLHSLDELPAGLVPAMQRILAEPRHGYPAGVGISAPQVGAAIAVVIATIDRVPTVMLNPRLVGHSEDTAWLSEGCLSIPGFYTNVKRHVWVDVEWEDLAWTTHFRRVGAPDPAPAHPLTPHEQLVYREGQQLARVRQFDARCVQHEVDHLSGRQITDDLTRQQKRRAVRDSAKARGI